MVMSDRDKLCMAVYQNLVLENCIDEFEKMIVLQSNSKHQVLGTR